MDADMDDMYSDESGRTIVPDTSFTEHVDQSEDDMYGDEFIPTILQNISSMEHMDQPEDNIYGNKSSLTILPDTSSTEPMDQVSVSFIFSIITDLFLLRHQVQISGQRTRRLVCFASSSKIPMRHGHQLSSVMLS